MHRQHLTRRSLLTAAAATVVAGIPAQEPDRHVREIRVTGVDIFPLRVNNRGGWVVIRVKTDAGLTGIGDASHSGRDDPAVPKVTEYIERMKGRTIFELEWLKQQCAPEWAEHKRATSCAWSAIEQALLDIQGQAMGVPCWALFGGKLRDAVRNYANINRGTDDRTPKGFAANARSAVDAGFDALKMASFDGFPHDGSASEQEAHTQLGIDCIQAARDVLGPDRDLLVDAHSHFRTYEKGMDLVDRLTPLNLFWLEEISRPFDLMSRYTEEAPMPIAGGESVFLLDGFVPYVEQRAADILMPDVKYAGGMRELKRISALGETRGMEIAPHGPASPIGNMAAAQVCVTIPNFSILEFSHSDAPWRAELVDPPEPMEKGMLSVPDTPGMGYKLNEKTVRERLAV